MIKIRIKKLVEAQGDADQLISLNMDYLKKKNPKKPEQNPKEYYMDLQTQAKAGVEDMFNKRIIDFIENLNSEYLPETGKKYFVKWLGNSIKDGDIPTKLEDVRYVKDYFEGTNASELPPKFADAYKKSEEWHEELAKTAGQVKGGYKTNEVVYEGPGGYKIVRMAWDTGPREDVKHDLLLEGDKMGNCVGKLHCRRILRSGESIFSLRDKENEPHVTMNIYHDDKSPDADNLDDEGNDGDWNDGWDDDEDGLFELDESLIKEAYTPHPSDKFDEIKGKQNKIPEDKYLSIIIPWIIDTFEVKQYISAESGLVLKSSYFDISKVEYILDETPDRENFTAFKALVVNRSVQLPKIIKVIKTCLDAIKDKKTNNDDAAYYSRYVLRHAVHNPNIPTETLKEFLSQKNMPVKDIVSADNFKPLADDVMKEKDYTIKTSEDRDIFEAIFETHARNDIDSRIKVYEKNAYDTRKKPVPLKGFLNKIMAHDAFPVKYIIDAYVRGVVTNSDLAEKIVNSGEDAPDEFYEKILNGYKTDQRTYFQTMLNVIRSPNVPEWFVTDFAKKYLETTFNHQPIYEIIIESPKISDDLRTKIYEKIIETPPSIFQSFKRHLSSDKKAPPEILAKYLMSISRHDLYFMEPLLENPTLPIEAIKARLKKTKDKKLVALLNRALESRKALKESKIVKKMLLLAGVVKL